MSTPLVPPRPARANAASSAMNDSTPQVPPRPVRNLDSSPARNVQSPLNELPHPLGGPPPRKSQSDVPRPPIVALPSIGQEGAEYASFDQLPPEAHGVKDVGKSDIGMPEQTRNIAADMKLHAPKASVPQSTVTSRIAPVTGTDSTQAAAAGIGQARPDDDVHKAPLGVAASLSPVHSRPEGTRRAPSSDISPLKQKPSFSRSTPNLPKSPSSKPASIYGDEHDHGIPEIGVQIPLMRMAGDVQAPAFGISQPPHAAGVGFYNDGSARPQSRRRSATPHYGPPGSYGLHGHSLEPHDQFERDWYAKNPDRALAEGQNIYKPPIPAAALSSADLNRLVNQSADAGMGTDGNFIGIPGEDVAFNATEEYHSRNASIAGSPAPVTGPGKRTSSGSQPATSLPFGKADRPDDAVFGGDEAPIHINPSQRRGNKVTGGGPADGGIDLGAQGGNTEEQGGWISERGPGTPILASDEITKRPGSAYMQPAVNPELHDDYESDQHQQDTSRRNSMRVPSRPSSRPNSVHGDYHGGNLHRFISQEEYHYSGMHTPLEEIEEYEPLIPEGEESEQRPKPTAAKAKRPGLEHHHFPSQDVWEDTPSSLQYSTTVDTPEPPREAEVPDDSKPTTAVFETPEKEHRRRSENQHNMLSDSKTLIKPHYSKAVRDELDHRPGMQRFPSRDIWEDTPNSMMFETTVGGPQTAEIKSPTDDGSMATSPPGNQAQSTARGTAGFGQVGRPSIPSRPRRRSKLAEELTNESKPAVEQPTNNTRDIKGEQLPSPEKAKAPAIPDRPKPTVPARPNKGPATEAVESADTRTATSDSADGTALLEKMKSPPVPKTKPAVPARPGGEKIAALKSGFMSDLNNRLKLGPQGPPPKAEEMEPELAEEVSKAPLADARKGRARGPARRKLGTSPLAMAEEKPPTFTICEATTIWSIDAANALQVPSVDGAAAETQNIDTAALEQVLSQNEKLNTAEPTLTSPVSPDLSRASISKEDVEAAGAEGDVPEPSISIPVAEEQEAIQPEFEAALADSAATSTDSLGKRIEEARRNLDAEESSEVKKEDETTTMMMTTNEAVEQADTDGGQADRS